jgi:hypothetical protein
MVGRQFDALAQLVSTMRSRRAALASLLGAALLGRAPGLVPAKRKSKGKPKRKRQGAGRGDREPKARQRRGTRKHKRKNTRQNRDVRSARVEQMPSGCCGTRTCPLPDPGSQSALCAFPGANLAGRDLRRAQLAKISGQGADFSGAQAQGASFGAACLQRANFTGANLTGAQFGKACLFGVDLRDAIVDVSRTLRTALLCRTTMPDGSVSNRDCAKSTPCCCETDLAAAVAAASNGDTIRLCAGRFHTVNVIITKDLAIVGAGSGADPATATILDAEGDGRILHTEADIEVRDLRITGGVSASGGAIFNAGALRLLGVNVVGNDGGPNGVAGAIANLGTLTLGADTHVADNRGDFGGGILTFGTLTLQAGSRVEGNEAGQGGGIHNEGGTLTLHNGSVVKGNTGAQGGGITNAGMATLQTGSRVEGNTSGNQGGGIINDGTLTLESGSVVTGNTARFGGGMTVGPDSTTTLQAGSRVTANRATETGGGIQFGSGTVSIADEDIVTNNDPNNCEPENMLDNCVEMP